MATVVTPLPEPTGRDSAQWVRKYPPLISLVMAVLIALVVLPSSLNVPQSNPSTTLEFAPVPPEDDTPPPPANGNLASLGLAGSSGLESEGAPGGDAGLGSIDEQADDLGLPPPGEIPAAIGKSPRTKKCVGNPPRQTEDAKAPPCVADFQGDNFGATYLGVEREEVRVLFYIQGNLRHVNTCRDPNQVTPDGQYFDLAKDPEPGEHCRVRALRVYQTYFNDRFQTYGRFVHFYVYFSGAGRSAEERKADAADNFERVRPFAVITDTKTFLDDYFISMAKRGVLTFDANFGRPASFFTKFPGRIWGYQPSQEQVAKMYAGLLCKKVAGLPVQNSGNPGENGKPRKYGLLYTSDKTHPELRAFKDIVVGLLKQCPTPIEFAAEGQFPSAGYIADTRYSPRYAQTQMADFKNKGVTTIIWPGGLETNYSKAARTLEYRPEWILVGDRLTETDIAGDSQEKSVWDHAWIVTNQTAVADIRQSPCYIAYREADPGADDTDARVQGCEIYDSIFQLFTGIQVAGPKLNPASIDKGYHAIPKILSTDPSIPACFYEPGDYTCIKDAMLEKYDSTGANGQGCWRMVQGGLRYPAEDWPEGNLADQYKPNDPQTREDDGDTCNTYTSSFLVNNGRPDPNNF